MQSLRRGCVFVSLVKKLKHPLPDAVFRGVSGASSQFSCSNLTVYPGASSRMVISSIEPSDAHSCMCRVCDVALATWTPRRCETCTISSSAALNLPDVCFKTRTIARVVAVSSVRPQPRREQADWIHMKCHPASRTATSSSADAAFSTHIHASSNGRCFRRSPSGSAHPTRRKIVGVFTMIAFRIFLRSPEYRESHRPGHSALHQGKSDGWERCRSPFQRSSCQEPCLPDRAPNRAASVQMGKPRCLTPWRDGV